MVVIAGDKTLENLFSGCRVIFRGQGYIWMKLPWIGLPSDPVSKSFQAKLLRTHGARGSDSLGLRNTKSGLKKLILQLFLCQIL